MSQPNPISSSPGGKAQATRDRILSASLKLFSQKGYIGATTREIATEAGIAELTLFRHFPKKELIMEELLRSRSALSAVQGVMPEIRTRSCQLALQTVAHVFLATLRDRKELIKIFFSEYARYPEQVKSMHQNFMSDLFETLAAYFRELQAKKILRRIDSLSAAQAFYGIFYAYFISRDMIGFYVSDRSEEDAIQSYIDVFINGIKGADYGKR